MLVMANQHAGSYSPATELELIEFWPLPFEELVWHLSIHVNDGILISDIIVFDMRRVKHRRFIPFLVYALIYPIIASNLVTVDTLSTWYDSACMHTCSTLSSKPLLR